MVGGGGASPAHKKLPVGHNLLSFLSSAGKVPTNLPTGVPPLLPSPYMVTPGLLHPYPVSADLSPATFSQCSDLLDGRAVAARDPVPDCPPSRIFLILVSICQVTTYFDTRLGVAP